MKMNYKILFSTLIIALVLFACQNSDTWDKHYNEESAITEKGSLLEELENVPNISKFTNALKEAGIDSIIGKNQLFTIFAFSDDAFDSLSDDIKSSPEKLKTVILFHIYLNKMSSLSIEEGLYKNLSGKYSLIERTSDGALTINEASTIIDFDYVAKNGMVHILDLPSVPSPSLYEFLTEDPTLKHYVDYILDQKIITFDKANSEIIAFNEVGNPIYDSIFVSQNTFLDQFPIASEDDQFTMLIPANIIEAIEEAKTGIPLRGPVPDETFITPLMKKGLFSGVYRRSELTEELISVSGELLNPETLPLIGETEEGVSLSNGRAFVYDGYEIDKDEMYGPQVLTPTELKNAVKLSSGVYGFHTANASLLRIRWTPAKQDLGIVEAAYGETATFTFPDFAVLPLEYKFTSSGSSYRTTKVKIEINGKELSNSPLFPIAADCDLGSVVFDEYQKGLEIKVTFIDRCVESWTNATQLKQQYIAFSEIIMEPVIQ